MKPILKKILSYIGIAFLGFSTGVGCLIGVSSCSSKNNDHKETQIKADRKFKILSNDEFDSIIGSNHRYYAVLKNYANPNGFLYQDSISLDNSRIMSEGYLILNLTAKIILNNQITQNNFVIDTGLSGGVYRLLDIRYWNASSGNVTNIYRASLGVYNQSNCAFTFTELSFTYDNRGRELSFFSELFDVYDLNYPFYEYNFNQDFNYNNFYQVGTEFLNRGNSAVVNAVGSTSQTKTYDLGWFESGGLVFDKINAYFYVTSYNYFQTHDNTWVKYESNIANNYYFYFHHLEYVNSATGYSITACNRVVLPRGNESGWTDVYLECAWTNQAFKTLNIQSEITNLMTKNVLESLVSNVLGGFTEINNDIDVGLGDVFNLISTAFSAWIPIFNIQIVPGVTIGLLLFLPLITGIIIVIIWIVKR